MDHTPQLIVRRKQGDDAVFSDLVRILTSRFGLDAYSTKQALRGFGLALLMKGPLSKLEGMADVCSDHGFDSWVIQPLAAPSRPELVRGISRKTDRLICHSRIGETIVHRSDYLLVVVGDLSGSMTDKLLRRQAVGGAGGGFTKGQQYDAILRGKPLVDVFVIRPPAADGKPKLAGILRFAPGKFNPAGLGDLAASTTVANLDAVVRILRSFAGAFLLDLNFGLSQLPRCRLENTGGSANIEKNNKSFQRYGWYLLQIFLIGKKRSGVKSEESGPNQLEQHLTTAAMVAAGTSKQPKKDQAVASEGMLGTAVAANATGLIQSLDDGEKMVQDEVNAAEGKAALPPPPYVNPATRFSRFWITGMGVAGFPVLAIVLFVMLSAMNKKVADLLIIWGLQKGVLFFVAGIACLGISFWMTHLRRLLENTPTSKVRSAAMGFVELCGTARRAYNVLSPVGQWPCVYYRTRRYRRNTNAQGHQNWQLVDELNSGAIPFYVQDETGKVLVDPKGAKIIVRHKHESFGGSGLARLFGAPTVMDMDEKFIEETIPEMATVYVLGFAKPQRQERAPLRHRAAMKLRDLKKDSVRLMKYDLNMDGKIDEQEWELARREMEKEALTDALMEHKDSGPQVVVGRARHSRLPFVVAEDQEPELARSFIWKSRLWTAACVVLVIIGVLSLLSDYS